MALGVSLSRRMPMALCHHAQQTTVDLPRAYNASSWEKLEAWVSQCRTMASLLAGGSERLRLLAFKMLAIGLK